MTNLFDQATAHAAKARLKTLRADSPRQWGKMTASQAVAHCADFMAMAVDDVRSKRTLPGYVFGRIIKSFVTGNETPMKRNAPTVPELKIRDDRDLDVERDRLLVLIDRFVAGGAAKCTTHPHPFFGRLTPDEWAVLSYKHLDHHLRQFGA